MIKLKVTQLKEQIYRYIYNHNVDIYIKLQSIFEFFIKDYAIEQGAIREEIDATSTYDLLENYISNNYQNKQILIDLFREINKKSNKGLKHYNQLIVLYDDKLIKTTVTEFNKLNTYLYGEENKKYYLDEKIFEKKIFDHNDVCEDFKFEEEKIYTTRKTIYKFEDVIITCGTSNNDFGFTIKNMRYVDVPLFKYSSLYAVIFNALQRNIVAKKDSIIHEFESENKLSVDYKKVFRFEIILLLMIKNNMYSSDNKIHVNSLENYNYELDCAIYHINKLYNLLLTLMKLDNDSIEIIIDNDSQFSISLVEQENLISAVDSSSRISKERYIWFSNNIRYNIKEEDKEKLKILLKDWLNFDNFKSGQFESIAEILNSDSNKIVIMPTGSGKSLIYYFVGLMQPSPSLVISPTEILIKDQIRNLEENNLIDDVTAHYVKDEDKQIYLINKFIYVTPSILQQRNSIISFINHNVECKIANVFLDEIHTISNWSHNFRPDYLMMAFNLKAFLDNPRYIGFTATANYRVLKDISIQLDFNFNNVFTPIELKKENLYYEFYSCDSEDKFINVFNKYAKEITENDYNKMMVFTKSDLVNKYIIGNMNETYKYDIDIFSESDQNSYDGFINGRRCILLTENDLGIGINIPYVNNVMHFGLPISKSKFVQEVGRAGRDGSNSKAVVVYKNKKSMSNEELKLLDFNTDIDSILDIISDSKSDLALAVKNIVGHLEHYAIMANRIRILYEKYIMFSTKASETIPVKLNSLNEKYQTELCLYFLVKIGVLYNWYIKKIGIQYVFYDIEIAERNRLENIKKSTIEYISLFGNAKKTIYSVEKAQSVQDIIYEVQNWYYNQFLLYHREQLINMIDFLDTSVNNKYSNDDIAEELSRYFSITNNDVEKDVLSYLNSIKEKQEIKYDLASIAESNNSNVFNNTFDYILTSNDAAVKKIKMERYLETKYDIIADLYIYLYNLLVDRSYNNSRFERIIINLNEDDKIEFLLFAKNIYNKIPSFDGKLEIINILCSYYDEKDVLKNIYDKKNKDTIYYGIVLKRINKLIEGVLHE